MERIHLPKGSMIKQIILSGLRGEGFTQIELAHRGSTQIYLFYNNSIKKVAIFKSAMSNNEFMIIGYELPGKLKIIIDEFKTQDDTPHKEIVAILEQFLDGSFFENNHEVTFL